MVNHRGWAMLIRVAELIHLLGNDPTVTQVLNYVQSNLIKPQDIQCSLF